MGFVQALERNVERNLAFATEVDQLIVFVTRVRGVTPGLNGPFGDRETRIRYDQVQVDVDGAAEAAAGLACTNRAIEGKQVGLGRCVVCSAIGAFQCAADGQVLLAIDPDVHLSATEPEPQFGRVDDAVAVIGPQQNTVDQNGQGFRVIRRLPLSRLSNFLAIEPTVEADPCQFGPDVLGRHRFRWIRKSQNHLSSGRLCPHQLPHVFRCFREYRPTALFAMQLPETGKEKLHVVGDFRHGAHGRAGGAHRVFAVNGNRRWNPLDLVHLRPVHTVHELSGVRRKRLDISSLAFGVEGVERQGGFSRAADTGDDGDPVERDLKIEILQVVLTSPADVDDMFLVHH